MNMNSKMEKPMKGVSHVKMFLLSGILSVFAATNAQAIGIDSMLVYTDENGEGEFVVTNSEDYRQYINVAISELTVEGGQIKKTSYNRENLSDWALEIHPSRTILEPGFKKVFSLKYQPKNNEHRLDQDKVFQVSFVPTPYFAEGEKEHAVKMAFGFAPLLIVPAKELKPLQYDLSYRGDKVKVVNKGNSFFTLYLDGCSKNTPVQARQQCSVSATVLAGRELDVTLPLEMQSKATLNAKMASHGNKLKAETILTKQS